MPSLKRVKTKYPGVYYVMGRSRNRAGKAERIYYIRYRRNGKEVEEKAGGQYRDAMTPAKAAKIRNECITGKRLPQKEIRYQKKFIKKNQKEFGIKGPAGDGEPLDKDLLMAVKNGETPQEVLARLRASEEKFRMIFENTQDIIAFIDLEGKIIEVSPAMKKLFGVRPEDAIGRYFFSDTQNMTPESLQEILETFRNKSIDAPPTPVEAKVFHKDGRVVIIEVTVKKRKKGGQGGYFCVIRDITERKLAEESLKKHRDHLEELVKERTANLEEANVALKVLLSQKDEHKEELEERVVSNVRELILPNLEKLKTIRADARDREILDIMENNLGDIVSSFGQKLSSKYYNLTSTELRIANLIKYGNKTKEIAELLYLSPRTVEFHRNNIRKKLGIKNRKINIRAYLLSLE